MLRKVDTITSVTHSTISRAFFLIAALSLLLVEVKSFRVYASSSLKSATNRQLHRYSINSIMRVFARPPKVEILDETEGGDEEIEDADEGDDEVEENAVFVADLEEDKGDSSVALPTSSTQTAAESIIRTVVARQKVVIAEQSN